MGKEIKVSKEIYEAIRIDADFKETPDNVLRRWAIDLGKLNISRNVNTPRIYEERLRPKEGEAPYIKRYRKSLSKPGSMPERIKIKILSSEELSITELRKFLRSIGYKGTGGSIDATLRVLVLDRYIHIRGGGENRRISVIHKS